MRHESQLPDPAGTAERVLTGARQQGEVAGLPEGSSAELFRVTRIP
jgi:hypothetical protein